ncbi:hypothetical protein GCM10019060_35730 [Novosphingobium pokkalii]|nr:hypothetical protein GCM10019060_35730 [Novosphingobium pokkalii]
MQVWRFAHTEGLSFKKSVLPAEQLRPKIARRREQWKKYQARPDPRRLIFVDETWAKTNMAPLRGWAPVGQRIHAKVSYGLVIAAGLRIPANSLNHKITRSGIPDDSLKRHHAQMTWRLSRGCENAETCAVRSGQSRGADYPAVRDDHSSARSP